MEYYLRRYNSSEPIEISKAQFDALSNAKRTILETVAIEEKFDVLLENYVELEETLHSLALRHMVFDTADNLKFNQIRNLINRRLVNLLSSARLYRDALLKHSKATLKNGSALERVKATLQVEAQPDAFKIMELLRNYSQHQELPLSSLSLGRSWEKHGTPEAMSAVRVVPRIDASELAKRRDIPPDLRPILAALGSKAEVMPLVRLYLEQFGKSQTTFRIAIEEIFEEAALLIESTVKAHEREEPFVVFAIHDQSGSKTEIQLFLEFLQYPKHLREKNRSLVNLSKHYVNLSTPSQRAR